MLSCMDAFTATLVIVSTTIAFGAIVLQFIAVLRHDAHQAVLSSMTWLLLAAFAAAMGAYFHQTLGEFFMVLLMALLSAGGLAGLILNLGRREVIQRAIEEQHTRFAPPTAEQAAAELRRKLDKARRKQATS